MKKFLIGLVFWLAFFFVYAAIGCLIPNGFEVLHNMAVGYTVVSLSYKFADWILKKD